MNFQLNKNYLSNFFWNKKITSNVFENELWRKQWSFAQILMSPILLIDTEHNYEKSMKGIEMYSV